MVELINKEDIDSYIDFLNQVFGYEAEHKSIEKMIKKCKVFVIKKEGKVIASVSVEDRFEYVKNQKYYYLSYLGVLKEYRRNGYATKLFEKIEELIKENNVKYIELTSGNQRRQAHYFYKSKAFQIKDTTVFVKIY